MKKTAPYLLLAIVAMALIALFITGTGRKKKLDERITFRKKDKIPYGTWVAFQALPQFFPSAAVYVSRKEPGAWDAVSEDSSGQLLIAITPRWMADEYEMDRLLSFVENGNDVFISTRYISSEAEEALGCHVYDGSLYMMLGQNNTILNRLRDSMELSLKKPPFTDAGRYQYPGKNFSSSFTRINDATTNELGFNDVGSVNFIHLKAGRGNFYLHLAPLAFSNYFLLHKNNMEYFENVFSVIHPGIKKILWDEYYLKKRDEGQRAKKKSWLKVLLNAQNEKGDYPFRWAIWVLLLLLVVYVLLEMRRKQRYIPVIAKPRNDSLDFVKTIGRLYHERGDHKNLCRKMSAYFLEYIRSRYKLPTGTLDEHFINSLQFKAGVPESEVREIVSFIKYAEDAPVITPAELTGFHRMLEKFYREG
jgi:hypothetical protein